MKPVTFRHPDGRIIRIRKSNWVIVGRAIKRFFRLLFLLPIFLAAEAGAQTFNQPGSRQVYGSSTTPVYMQSVPGAPASIVSTATAISTMRSHFQLEAAKGNIPGVSVLHKFGENPACSTTQEDMWAVGGDYIWPQSTTTIRVKSGGNAADTAAGAGAQKVRVEGLDDNWNLVSNDLVTAGASASAASSSTFVRIYRAYVADVGAYGGNNTGNIDIETVVGSTTIARIVAGLGQTQMSMFTIPAGKTGFFMGGYVTTPTNKVVAVKLWGRPGADDFTTPYSAKRMLGEASELSSPLEVSYGTWRAIPPKTDIWVSCQTAADAANVTVDYDVILVDN